MGKMKTIPAKLLQVGDIIRTWRGEEVVEIINETEEKIEAYSTLLHTKRKVIKWSEYKDTLIEVERGRNDQVL